MMPEYEFVNEKQNDRDFIFTFCAVLFLVVDILIMGYCVLSKK